MKTTRIIWQCDSCGGIHEENNIEGCGKIDRYLLQWKSQFGVTSAEIDLCNHCKMACEHLLIVLKHMGLPLLKLIRK